MKKPGLLFLLPFFLLLTSCGTQEPATETITLRYAQQNPDTGWSTINCVEPWLRQVEEATGGKVKIEAYHGQTLAKAKDLWNATKTGIADIGWICHGYFPKLTPLSDVISLPALPFTTAEKGSEVMWKLYEQFPEIRDEYKDVKVLLFYTSEPYTLITRNKPVTSIEDIKGLKIRITGGPPTEMVQSLGGVPLLVPMTDAYISLQKGVADGMGTPWEAIHTYRFYEVADHYTEVPFPAVYFSIVMNRSTWDKLPNDVQDAIMSVSGLAGSKFWGKNFFDSAKTVSLEKIEASGKGDNIHRLSQEERDRWIEVGGKPVWSDWTRRMEEAGFANASRILDAAIQLSGE
jgi:TRAP-type C4-dicarboxylate transport system substrate-binding protein